MLIWLCSINHVSGDKQLNVAGNAKESGSGLICYKPSKEVNAQFLIKAVA